MLPEHETTARELLGSVDFIGAAKAELDALNRDAMRYLRDKAELFRLSGDELRALEAEAQRDRIQSDYIQTLRDVAKLLDAE